MVGVLTSRNFHQGPRPDQKDILGIRKAQVHLVLHFREVVNIHFRN